MPQRRILIAAEITAFGHALSAMHDHDQPKLVTSGTDALAALQQEGFDLALLQDCLPGISGLEVCEQFSKDPSPQTSSLIVFSHRAEIQQVALDKGASGFLKLPCTAQQLRKVIGTSDKKRTILLVDDSRVIHKIVEEILKDEGYELLHAFDGEEGFRKVLEFIPDLIISDIDMPGVNGYEFCQQVKETGITEHIPVIMQSARGAGLDIDKGFDVGANDYLTKPVNPDELLSRIQQILKTDEQKARERILVVDDSKTIRNFMTQGLEQQGFAVTTAANGREGLAAAIEKKPDLVVTDLEMPIMNGREFTRELRKNELLEKVPVVMLTASGSERDRIKGEHAGVSAYLSKPFPPDKLVVLVEKLIAERKLLVERGELQNRNQFIREVFGRYMTDDVVTTLLDSSDGLKLGGERRRLTILMSDIRGFTSISEGMPPEKVVSMLNNYLEAMTGVIVKRGGTINNLMGDGILTIFGAPIGKEDDALRAVVCAVEMQLAMTEVNKYNRENGFPEFEMGIGINTGEVVVGNIGSKKYAQYGVIGSHVNMAARIESYTVGGQVLLSEETVKEVSQSVQLGQQMQIEPKGSAKPLTIYEVTGVNTPYNIALPSESEELQCLEMDVPIEYSILEEKVAGRTIFAGRIVALSTKNALVSCQKPPAVLENLKIQVLDAAGGTTFKDVYGKVVTGPREDGEPFRLRFTSMPAGAAAFFGSLVDRDVNETSEPSQRSSSGDG